MSPDLREAIDSARSAGLEGPLYRSVQPLKRISFGRLHHLLKAVIRELPDHMTVRELLDDLEGPDQ